MRSLDRPRSGRYRARFREVPGGPQRTRTFTKKADASAWLTQVEHQLLTGTYTPREGGQIALADYAAGVRLPPPLARTDRRAPGTETKVAHLPDLVATPLANLSRAPIETWAKDLGLAPSSMLLSHRVNPAYVPERLGHSVETFVRTYAPALLPDDDRVRALVDHALIAFLDRDEAAS